MIENIQNWLREKSEASNVLSIRFCDESMLKRFAQFHLVRDYIEEELVKKRRSTGGYETDLNAPVNLTGLTNASVNRAYIGAYLQNHPRIREDMTVLVRQLDPSPTGLPIEIYVFTNTTEWIEYEAIQADIFDHLLAVVPEFDLRVFQEPSGSDFESLVHGVS